MDGKDAPIGMETARVGQRGASGGWRCGAGDAFDLFRGRAVGAKAINRLALLSYQAGQQMTPTPVGCFWGVSIAGLWVARRLQHWEDNSLPPGLLDVEVCNTLFPLLHPGRAACLQLPEPDTLVPTIHTSQTNTDSTSDLLV